MFSNNNTSQQMPNAGSNPGSYGYGPPSEQAHSQEMGNAGYGQNPNQMQGGYGNNPNQMQYPGGYGAPPPGAGGYPQAAPGAYPGSPAPPGGPASYTRMSSTNPMNLIWFAAACSVMIGASISCITMLFSLEWVDALQMAYLFVFGLLLAVLDTPLFNQVAIVSELRTAIGKYIAVLQRVTGKGAAYIFLGCAMWSSMYANFTGGVMLFLAVLIGLFVVLIGSFSMAIAILKSRNLNLVRLELRKEQGSLKQMYDMHAKMNPMAGITQEEFKKMTPYARGVSFEAPDIKLIFNALSSNPRRDVISLEDLTSWINGNHMVFI